MSRRRALVLCPGRGSYDRSCLGSLASRSEAAAQAIAVIDRWRSAMGRPTVTELDAADSFRASLHVAGEHASALTFAVGFADWLELDRERYEVVGVAGNSMGWYTALGVSGALSLDDTVRLIDTMGAYQEGNIIGGQILYPTSDTDWRSSPAALAAIEAALASARAKGHTAAWSIDLGGYAVLGADRGGIKHLLAALPPDTRGSRTFPLQLPLHSAFHTSLMQGTSQRAQAELAGLSFQAPRLPLFDGRGQLFRPRWSDPAELAAYTLGHQVVEPYDLTTSVRTALRHTGADVVVCLGPGNPLGGPVARILVAEGWRGARSRGALEALEPPALLSFGFPPQRSALLAS
ncbi:MAG TPA: ACP S-malonyltransferase [Deltaproteobacteria bacterium]|nr:ACP S-malonyltransferase [Deltaproteobacteria bacterium]